VFALEFSALVGEDDALDFIVTTCLEARIKSGTDVCLSLELFIEGTYKKYNNNAGWVYDDDPDNPINQSAQAFSHFTFERSWGRFLVCHLQGVDRLLTDPSIHTKDPLRFQHSDANMGVEGFKFFFATHKCNAICRRLELKSTGLMLVSGQFAFREW